MSKPESQTQTPKPFFKAPIYEKSELKAKIEKLNREIQHITDLWTSATVPLVRIHITLCNKTSISDTISRRIDELIDELKNAVQDAIDELVINELQLDPDIEEYERQYNVKFDYDTERQLGVVMLKENETVKPVVIWTTYREVDYYEGEPSK